jgi:hypothetical protein
LVIKDRKVADAVDLKAESSLTEPVAGTSLLSLTMSSFATTRFTGRGWGASLNIVMALPGRERAIRIIAHENPRLNERHNMGFPFKSNVFYHFLRIISNRSDDYRRIKG